MIGRDFLGKINYLKILNLKTSTRQIFNSGLNFQDFPKVPKILLFPLLLPFFCALTSHYEANIYCSLTAKSCFLYVIHAATRHDFSGKMTDRFTALRKRINLAKHEEALFSSVTVTSAPGYRGTKGITGNSIMQKKKKTIMEKVKGE